MAAQRVPTACVIRRARLRFLLASLELFVGYNMDGLMLVELHIENVAIVDRLNLRFGPGLIALTGETGAGKSILIDAISLALGDRADTNLIRQGCDQATVTAVFDVRHCPVATSIADEIGIEPEDGSLFLSRELSANGRSGARINGRPAPISSLKKLAEALVDLHGQHEHQSLFRVASHLELLDDWLGAPAVELKHKVRELYLAKQSIEAEIAELTQTGVERERALDLLRYQAEEIEAANLTPGEDEALESVEKRLANADRLGQLAAEAIEALDGEASAYEALARAQKSLSEAAKLDDGLEALDSLLLSALDSARDGATALRRYAEEIEAQPEELDRTVRRLDQIRSLKRKYGESIAAVIAFGEEARRKLGDFENQDERLQDLRNQLESTTIELTHTAANLTRMRTDGATSFAVLVNEHLQDLGMTNAQFVITVEPKPIDARGADAIEYLFSANVGESPRPLTKIASGGEISRVMLAIKSALAGASPVGSLIFDEVDAGLGGRAATIVADKLSQLSKNSQALCVTHLAQIAARADQHFSIDKQEIDGRTVAVAQLLSGPEREEEIARMIAGDTGQTAIVHARQMLSEAQK